MKLMSRKPVIKLGPDRYLIWDDVLSEHVEVPIKRYLEVVLEENQVLRQGMELAKQATAALQAEMDEKDSEYNRLWDSYEDIKAMCLRLAKQEQ